MSSLRKKGHYANECEEERQTGTAMLMDGIEKGEFNSTDHFQFLQHESGTTLQLGANGRIPKTWILLDNQSTVDIFHNSALLKNIRESKTFMDIHCNAGVTSTNMVGDLPGYSTVQYHPKGVANILSLAQVRGRSYHVTYDCCNGHGFKVHKPDGMVCLFKQSTRGLFYMGSTGDTEGVTLVNTVANNCSSYTNHDYLRAVLARKLQKIIGQPRTRTFLTIVEKNLLPNCPITRKDILAAEAIFGCNVGSLKGKTVWQKATWVEGFSVDIPSSIMSRYRSIVLASDIMFVNKIPFFMSISQHIKFGTAKMLQNQKKKTILTAIKQIKSIYMRRGFVISTLLMDGQFESLRGNLAELQISLNTVSNNEHVPDIERHIQTTKEHA